MWAIPEDVAVANGFTHEGLFWGVIPVYLSDLEFAHTGNPIGVAVKYPVTRWLFNVLEFGVWLFTPPNAKTYFLVTRRIDGGVDE